MPSDLDLPLQPSVQQIRSREFGTVKRGYDPDQVRTYLAAVAERLGALERSLKEANAAAQNAPEPAVSPEPAVDPYDALAKKFAGLIATADREATRLLDEARGESTRIVEEARADADRIRVDAQSRAEEARAEGDRLLKEARGEADRALSSLASRRQQLVTQLQTMQSRLLSAAKDLDVPADDPASDLPEPIASVEAGAAAEVAQPPVARAPAASPSVDPGSSSDLPIEDLWVASEENVDLPNLSSIEFDFDDDQPAGER